jgi:hypothetical protein
MTAENPPDPEQMTKDERSLLLYFETAAVDNHGRIDPRRMNGADRFIAEEWNRKGFVEYGRIASEHLKENSTHWCHLSEPAWIAAAQLRRSRAMRTWANRTYITTEEKRSQSLTI